MPIIRTPEDAQRALLNLAAWDNLPRPTLTEVTNMLVGMKLALRYPEWTLALLNLAWPESKDHRLDGVYESMFARYPIGVTEARE